MTARTITKELLCLLPAALAILFALRSAATMAQESDGAFDPADEVEEIVVTGSRLKRRDFTSPSPISTIDMQQIAFSGQATLEESLNQMPQVTPDFNRSSNNPGDGKARINLRGLGSGRTLVLLNGRRLAPSGIGSSVDVNNLPQVLIDRVEIITGGASTAYGSDAIAGVVNFITRSDFEGLGMEASAYVTEQGDSNTYDINAAYGHNFSNGRGNVTLFAGYLNREETFAGQRAFTAVPYTDTWEGTIRPTGSTATPASVITFPRVDYGNGPAFTTFLPSGDPREFVQLEDQYNYAPINYLQLPLERASAGVFLNYGLTDRIESYFEISYASNRAVQTLAEVPYFGFTLTNLDNPVLTDATRQLFTDNFDPVDPGDPNIVGFSYRKRLSDLGQRIIDNNFDYTRAVAGLRGELFDGWDYDLWVTWTRGEEKEYYRNDASLSRFQQGMLVDPSGQCYDPSGGCVPLNVFGEGNLSPEAIEFIRFQEVVNRTSRTQKLASAVVNGTPMDSWAGPIDVALGAEWRSDTGSFKADDALFTGDSIGFSGSSSVNGTESIFEIYGEARIPLAEGLPFAEVLALEIGGRLSDYKNAGRTDSYKIGGEWAPIGSFRLRAMYQKSVRAPNLQEAFEEQRTDVGSYNGVNPDKDPCTAASDPIGNNVVDKCVLQGIPQNLVGTWEATEEAVTEFITGGNPELKPENAETWTVGAVLSPDALPNWQFTLDYFNLRVEDTIGSISADLICFDPLNTDNLFCNNMQRDPVTYDVSRLIEPYSNRGALHTTGFDAQVSYQTELPEALSLGSGYADLNVDVIWTHMITNETQENPVSTVYDCAGLFGYPCNIFAGYPGSVTYPNDRVTLNANYAAGDFMTHLTWRWIAGTDTANYIYAELLGIGDIEPGIPSIPSKNYFDLGFGYAFSDHIYARLTIANLLDTEPPMMADNASNNTDTGFYDVYGRSYTLSFSMKY